MGYKNTAGNSSISNEMGQWRYFNSALDKLGVYKGATINLQAPEDNIPQKMNWMAAAGAAVAGGMGVYEAYREREYKKAEEYLNTHSLEQYKQQIKDGNVPFQYDYLAMSRLKQGMGENIFKLAAQDFQEDVDRNKFRGMSPEQVDAAFYGHVQSSIEEFNDGSLGFETDDYYFNKGVYAKADETRMGMLLEHSKVEDDFLQQQFEQNVIAKIQHAVANPDKNCQEVINVLNSLDEDAYRMSPESKARFLDVFTKTIAGSDNGQYILSQIGDYKFSSGQTFNEMVGEIRLNEMNLASANHRYRSDAAFRTEINDNVRLLESKGDFATLRNLRDREIANNGNLVTDIVELYDRAYNNAIKVAEANNKAREKGLKDTMAMDHYALLVCQNSRGEIAVDLQMAAEDLGLSSRQVAIANKKALALLSLERAREMQMLAEQSANLNPEDINNTVQIPRSAGMGMLLDFAASDNADQEFKHQVKLSFENALAGTQEIITNIAEGREGLNEDNSEVLRVRDASTGILKTTSFLVPKGFSEVFDRYKANPRAVKKLLSKSDVELLTRIESAINQGRDPIKTIGNSTVLVNILKKNQLKIGKTGNPTQEFETATAKMVIAGINNSFSNSSLAFNEQVLSQIYDIGLKLAKDHYKDDGTLDVKGLVDDCISYYTANNTGLIGVVVVPSEDLRLGMKDISAEFRAGGANNDDLSELGSAALFKILKNSKGLDIDKENVNDYSGSYYDVSTKKIHIVDADNQERAVVDLKTLAKVARDEFDERNRQEAETRRKEIEESKEIRGSFGAGGTGYAPSTGLTSDAKQKAKDFTLFGEFGASSFRSVHYNNNNNGIYRFSTTTGTNNSGTTSGSSAGTK